MALDAASRRSLSDVQLGQTDHVSIGEELIEQRRRRRRTGDPRLTDEDKELLRRPTTGDLVGAFQTGLDAVSRADPLLGGDTSSDA